jgi:hypothetical protein
MLEKLLTEIRGGGTLQPTALAAKLNTSVGIVEMMLEDLERRGFLTQVNNSCEESCGGCPLVGDCATTSPQGRMWMLTHYGDHHYQFS